VLLIQSASAFLHLMVVSIIIFVTAPLFFGASYPKSFLGYFLIIFILLFSSIALGLLIGVTARSQSVAMMLSQGIFLPTMMLSGIMFPASMLPLPLRLVGRLFPATYIMQSISGLAFKLPTNIEVTLALSIATGIGVAAVGLTVVRFRAMGKSL
jgi:ABC-2 type transport system permease protein